MAMAGLAMAGEGMADRAPPGGWSLARRVALRAVLAAVLVLGAILTVLVLELQDVRNDLDDQSLQAQARQIMRFLDMTGDVDVTGRPVFTPPPAVAALYGDPAGNQAFALVDGAGRLVLGSAGIDGPLADIGDMPAATSPGDPHGLPDLGAPFRTITDGGRSLTGAGFVVMLGDRAMMLQVGQGPDHPDVLADSLIEEFLETAAWWVVGAFTVLIAVTLWTIRDGLAPLRRLSARAARIGPATSGVRLADGLKPADLPREVAPLVEAIDRALDRLDGALDHQRSFIADAAHELRTPIAALRARVEATLPADQARLLAPDFDRLARLAGQLLRLAEVDTLAIEADERADLAAIGRDVLADLAPLAVQRGRSLALDGAGLPVMVRGRPEPLARLLRNLVENGLAHCPAGGTVTVRVLAPAHGAGAELLVEDDGPGIPQDRRDRIFERFWRADRRRGDGAGLGLAIVQRIADAHGAGVSVGDGPAGGACFRLRFPPVDRPVSTGRADMGPA
ncbi:histidine kinase [Tistrella bauzanensis]|uniref:histidine kinase n=2 Tax=Tistrella bauzanensis TaxID=657419 RepID=A0ABQ1J2W1_9PROT|nr:histidine kinase [Tistrella bauzanensis]